MEVSFQPHAPALMNPLLSLHTRSLRGWVILQSRFGRFGGEKNLFPLSEFQIIPTRLLKYIPP